MTITSIISPDHVEEEAKIVKADFYKFSKLKLRLFYLLSVLTLGLIPLLCCWKQSLKVKLMYKRAKVEDCEHLLIEGTDGTVEHIPIETIKFPSKGTKKTYRCFSYRLYVYYFDKAENAFKPYQFALKGKTYNAIHIELGKGMGSIEECHERQIMYGINILDIPTKSNLRILFLEVLSPYYLFQLFAIIFWAFTGYWIYSCVISILSMIALSFIFIKLKNNYDTLKEKALYQTEMRVYRPIEDGGVITHVPSLVDSACLVPGDIIEIPVNTKMPCDVILLSGTCIMNESMLMGESELIVKQALPRTNQKFDLWSEDQHILFAGTECLEAARSGTDPQVIGVVIRTGFQTIKGRLIKSYLYTKPESFQFYRDSLKFIGAMATLGFIAFIYSITKFVEFEVEASEVVIRAFDIITIAIPPVLPTCLSIGNLIASIRLESKDIIAKSERKINIAGRIKIACFDKTGTLSNDSYDLLGVKPVTNPTEENVVAFLPLIKENICPSLFVKDFNTISRILIDLMATCHNISFRRGKLSGDPLDLKMVEAVESLPQANNKKKNRIDTMDSHESCIEEEFYTPKSGLTVIKRFPYSVKLQRTTVIVRVNVEMKQKMFVKGVPEVIQKLCKPSTVPASISETLFGYRQRGYKVVACAYKILEDRVKPSDNLAREFFEKDLDFLGLLVFENRIKDITAPIISKLIEADIQPVMLTGDDPYTALFVAQLCGIVSQNQKVLLGSLGEEAHSELKKLDWKWMEHTFDVDHECAETFSQKSERIDGIQIDIDEEEGFSGDLLSTGQLNVLKNIKNNTDVVIAMTSDAFHYLISLQSYGSPLYQTILQKTKIFAQLRPDDKAAIIKEFQKQGNIVSMCGDGVSDCPALKVANIGLSLSQGEPSLAASFVSKVPDISCLEILVREGRSSLVTSFECFKFIFMYALIQTLTSVILYASSSALPDNVALFQDLVITLPIILSFLLTRPSKELSKDHPSESLVSIPVLASVLGLCFIQIIVQAIAVTILHNESWYANHITLSQSLAEAVGDEFAESPDYDSTLLFMIGNIQYITMVIVFTTGKPFRQPFYRNWVFTLILISTIILSLLIILVPIPSITEHFEMMDFAEDQGFRWGVFGLAIFNLVLSYAYEKLALKYIVILVSKILKKKTQ